MVEKKILLIRPYDNTTSFLERIKNHLHGTFNNNIHYFSIKPNDDSHKLCLETIIKHPSDGFIIFLGHGRSDKLYGSKGKFYDNKEFVSSEVILENPDFYYYNDNFINESNIEVFNEKKVFCLACNSNDRIGKLAYEHGAKTFFGFGDIPTSEAEFRNKGQKVSGAVVSRIKTELNYIIKQSLAYIITHNKSFEELFNLIHFITNQRISNLLVNEKKFKERHILADYMYYLKKEIIIYGEKKINFIE